MNSKVFSIVPCVLVASLFGSPDGTRDLAFGAAKDKPKVILLGLDGADAVLTKKFIDEGHLPNMKRLSEMGTYSPLGTSNPAQSPVSWAVLETASNPGKTNIPDFVRRVLPDGGTPIPMPTGNKRFVVDASELGDHMPLSAGESFMVSLVGVKGLAVLGAGALLIFVLVFLASKVILRFPGAVAAVIGLLFAGGFGFLGKRSIDELPTQYPVSVSEMQGTRFWKPLDDAGVRFVGLQVPAVFPCVDDLENGRMLGGLFTPDVAGGTGSWYVYTNDEWASNGMETSSGGTVYKLYVEKDGVIRPSLRGPTNFVREGEFKEQIAAVRSQLESDSVSDAQKAELEDTLDRLKSEQQTFNSYDKKIKVEYEVEPDYEARKVAITIDGVSQTVGEGEWSEFFRVDFPVTRQYVLEAVVRFYVEECHVDDEQLERLRLFVPPISISPESQPINLPISTPKSYVADLAREIGMFDTIGWACWSNALKDAEIPEQGFMTGLDNTQRQRTKQLIRELDRDDWDVLFHVESTTDRACHMLYRFIDPEHPQYDTIDRKTGEPLRETMVTAYGRTFPLKDGIVETFKEADKIVGEVLKRIDSGALGDNVTFMIVSDHGFQPFRWGVELNTWLARNGYLKIAGQEGFKPGQMNDIPDGTSGQVFSYVDWEETVAYSMGLGKIYINLKGREPKGIVPPGDFDRLRKEIIQKLEAFVDPVRGQRVVKAAYDGQEIYHGKYKEEPGDIVLGFDKGYRVSWDTSAGGFDEDTAETLGIADNPQVWSGDHVGVDPELVKGIFITNREYGSDFEPNLINIAPTILELFEVARPQDWDGEPFVLH